MKNFRCYFSLRTNSSIFRSIEHQFHKYIQLSVSIYVIYHSTRPNATSPHIFLRSHFKHKLNEKNIKITCWMNCWVQNKLTTHTAAISQAQHTRACMFTSSDRKSFKETILDRRIHIYIFITRMQCFLACYIVYLKQNSLRANAPCL